MILFALITLLCWSGSDFFSKIGCRDASDKYTKSWLAPDSGESALAAPIISPTAWPPSCGAACS